MLSPDVLFEVINHLSFTERKRLLTLNRLFSEIIGMWRNVTLRVASFDIGKNNFAQYVEDCSLDSLRDVKMIYNEIDPKELKYKRGDGLQQPLLDSVFRNGTRVNIGVFDFQNNLPESKKLDNPTRLNFLNHLDSYGWLWNTCDIFIVEQQYVNLYGKHRGINIDALKLGEATTMWFLEHYPCKIVKSFGSQHKTRILQAPNKMTKPQRKKWATVKALEIFKDRGDSEAVGLWELVEKIKRKRINTEERVQSYLIDYGDCSRDIFLMCDTIVRTRQKLDDISDVVVQLQAYKYKTFVMRD